MCAADRIYPRPPHLWAPTESSLRDSSRSRGSHGLGAISPTRVVAPMSSTGSAHRSANLLTSMTLCSFALAKIDRAALELGGSPA